MKTTANCKKKSKNFRLLRRWIAAALACAALCACARQPASQVRGGIEPLRPVNARPRAVTRAERVALRRSLDAIFASYIGSTDSSLCVMDASGSIVYDRSCNSAVVPASAQKVVIASAVLADLGRDFRFHTAFKAAGAVVDGRLAGDLWLIGGGDPILVSNDLRGGIKVLRARGLRRVDGGLAVDASALAGPERNPLWDPADVSFGFSAATSGMSLDQDTIEFHIRPTSGGNAAQVTLAPPSRMVSYSGRVMTVPPGYMTAIDVAPLPRENAFVVSGQIAAGGRERIAYLPISRVPNYVGTVVETMLEARGIRTSRAPRTGSAPPALNVLWDHRSPALEWIVAKMLFESNNHIAEQLLRTLGRARGGTGDDRHGIAAERAFLRSRAIPDAGLRLVDGSGLSGANRVSGATLASLLARAQRLRPANPLYRALPRGGVEGTLKEYHFHAAAGRVRAKSGHLNGVSSLAGYVSSHRHGRIVFAFLLNQTPNQWKADKLITRAVDRLAEF